jgi:hypothetical protein
MLIWGKEPEVIANIFENLQKNMFQPYQQEGILPYPSLPHPTQPRRPLPSESSKNQ